MAETVTGTEFDHDNATMDNRASDESASPPPTDRPDINIAADYLRHHGITVVARLWRCRYGVLDLIAQDEDCTVFIHVTDASRPSQRYSFDLSQRLRRLALLWMAEQDTAVRALRFDIVTVNTPQPQDHTRGLTHHRAVF